MTDCPEPTSDSRVATEMVARESYGKLLALLIHQFHDIELAEDGLQDALLAAINAWPDAEIPQNPEAWLLQTSRHRIIDRLRRQQNYAIKLEQAEFGELFFQSDNDTVTDVPDERLRLIFTCCHPALASQTQVALTLQTLCGLTTQQVASAFILPTSTMAQRLVRAKRKIRAAKIPYEVPDSRHLPDRLDNVLSVVYLIFNEGYFASAEQELIDRSLCDEAIRLAETVVQLMSGKAEIWGLLALMLFHYSRFDARQDSQGQMIDLEHQDRKRWQTPLIERADKILMSILRKGQPGPYQLQAAISAVHAHTSDFSSTDWKQIVMLYHRLEVINPNPVVSLNLAVALSYAEDAKTALSYLSQIPDIDRLNVYHPYHAARADLLRRDLQMTAAARHYREAIRLCENLIEKRYLESRLETLVL